MEIISIYFAALSVLLFFIYYFLNQKFRILFLVSLSGAFIASLSINLLIYVLIYSLINYFLGLRLPSARNKKTLFRIGLFINLIQIIILKYFDFTIAPSLELIGVEYGALNFSEIIVPIGISFFTLQGIGYLVNIKMGWEKPEKRFLNFLLYIIYYPKFLSGPIERSNHFLPQLVEKKTFNSENIVIGLRIALWGFFKKVIIANHLAATIGQTYSDIDSAGGLNVLLVILIQPLYLYFDFSGYTDIAIGFAKTMGIDLLPNFNRPFLSENVTTLWKRMHMSLSFWFNDYVFKQLSFKVRKWGKYAAVFAVFITFTLFGIWHGAGWTFMILGFLQALAINYEFFTKKWRVSVFSKMPDTLRIWVGRLFTYLFFGISHIFFFSPDLSTALTAFSKIQSIGTISGDNLMSGPLLFGLFFAIIAMVFEVIQNDFTHLYDKIMIYWTNHKAFRYFIYLLEVTLIVSQLGGSTSFIYEMF